MTSDLPPAVGMITSGLPVWVAELERQILDDLSLRKVAALMAVELGTETAAMQKALETHVRAQLEELAQPRIAL